MWAQQQTIKRSADHDLPNRQLKQTVKQSQAGSKQFLRFFLRIETSLRIAKAERTVHFSSTTTSGGGLWFDLILQWCVLKVYGSVACGEHQDMSWWPEGCFGLWWTVSLSTDIIGKQEWVCNYLHACLHRGQVTCWKRKVEEREAVAASENKCQVRTRPGKYMHSYSPGTI